MNFFEQELRKLAAACGITNPVFAARACYGELGGDNRVKLQFVELGYSGKYEGLQATVLSRLNGPLDSVVFRFSDIWGKKAVSNRNFSDGIIPHIWSNDERNDWYVYHPTDADFKQLGKAVGAYLDVFTDRAALRRNEQARDSGSVMNRLRESQRAPAAPKKTAGSKKPEPEL